jgi:predicted chitinase
MALTANQIRVMLKDKPSLNILLQNELQSDNELINEAIDDVVDVFNWTPPILEKVTLGNFPSRSILFLGVAWKLAQAEAERQLRNNVNYSAQGLNAGIDDKFGMYHQLAADYEARFTQATQAYKQAANIAAAWGESFSPYEPLGGMRY